MRVFKYLWLSLENLKVHKLRSFLTMLGVIIGIFNLTLVLAVLQGGRRMILEEMADLGANVIYIYSEYPINERDISSIRRIPGIEDVFPDFYLSTQIKIGKDMKEVCIQGVVSGFERLYKIEMIEGRFIKRSDGKKRICVMTERLSQKLFGRSSPIGKEIILENERFKVVGLSKEKMVLSKMVGGFIIFAPSTTVQRMLPTEDITGLIVILKDIRESKAISERIDRLLNKDYLGEKRYWVHNIQEILETTKMITGIIALVIGAIAGISLIVGGIGIMNIMLVQVRERTREIGIRKAFGASDWDIKIQFLVESCLLTLSGGIIGLVSGLIFANLIAYFLKIPFIIGFEYLLLGLLVSSLVGISFGLYPARLAARITPIEALRYE